jgi:hypothetical protein
MKGKKRFKFIAVPVFIVAILFFLSFVWFWFGRKKKTLDG